MSEQYPNRPDFGIRPSRPSLFGYLRALLRLTGALLFCVAAAAVGWLVYPVVWIAPGKARAVRTGLSRRWMRGVLWFTGTRIAVRGPLPKPPCFLVFNHPCWLDFFAITAVLEVRFVAEAQLKTAPIIGVLFRGLYPLFVKRTQEDTPRIINAVADALRAGDSVIFAPEAPVLDAPRGTNVRQFRAALFEAAIQTGTPVSCLSLTYRTPDGCPSALHSVIFHTEPIYRAPGSDLPDARLESYGFKKIAEFFRYIIGMLALPHHEVIITFAEETVMAEDRITLANKAHEAVCAIFTPMQ